MNLVRHELGLLEDGKPLSDQGHLPCDLFALRQRRDRRSSRCCGASFPWCAGWAAELKRAVRRLCRGQAGAERARLRRPAALLGADDERAGARRRHRRPLRPCAGRRIPGHQPAAGVDPAGAEARRPRPHRGRRRRAVDLFVPRRDGAQHPRLSRASSRPPADIVTLDRNYRSTQPILAAANAVIGLAAERFTKNLWTDRTSGAKPQLVTRARRGRPGALRRRARAGEPRGRHAAEAAGGAVPHLAATADRSRSS